MNSTDVVTVCPHCGAEILSTNPVVVNGGLRFYQCTTCGFQQAVEVNPSLQFPVDSVDPPPKTVTIEWAGDGASPGEMAALRQLLPRYAEIPILELRTALTSRRLLLGEYQDWEARDLVERGERLGLKIVVG